MLVWSDKSNLPEFVQSFLSRVSVHSWCIWVLRFPVNFNPCTEVHTQVCITENAFVTILAVKLDGTLFTGEMCATTVPLFKVTILLDRFRKANPIYLDPALKKS